MPATNAKMDFEAFGVRDIELSRLRPRGRYVKAFLRFDTRCPKRGPLLDSIEPGRQGECAMTTAQTRLPHKQGEFDALDNIPGLRHRLRRFLKFAAVCGLGVALNVALLNIMFNFLHINRYVANLASIAIVTGWNFWINLKLSWRDTSPR